MWEEIINCNAYRPNESLFTSYEILDFLCHAKIALGYPLFCWIASSLNFFLFVLRYSRKYCRDISYEDRSNNGGIPTTVVSDAGGVGVCEANPRCSATHKTVFLALLSIKAIVSLCHMPSITWAWVHMRHGDRHRECKISSCFTEDCDPLITSCCSVTWIIMLACASCRDTLFTQLNRISLIWYRPGRKNKLHRHLWKRCTYRNTASLRVSNIFKMSI